MIDERALNKPLIGVAVIVVLGAVGGWYYWHGQRPVAPATELAQAPAPTAPVTEGRIEHPMPPTPADTAKIPLPAIEDSDAPFGEALSGAVGTSIAQFLVPERLIRHIVVSIDNLPRQKVAVDKRPIAPVAGVFIVDGDELHATIDSQNYQRYAPMIDALKKVDTQRLMTAYQHFYPLFQKAYQDLGYPNGYFNDRVVQVIDLLLATPQPKDPIELVRPNVMYVFADPALEARPAGQKLLLRMGPDNEAAVKAKLTEIRALVIAAPKPAV
jgi:Protein of unknown function (DUF3014)